MKMFPVLYLDLLQSSTTGHKLERKEQETLPDQNLSQVSRELPINVLLSVGKLHSLKRRQR
jgi:hypothetical protein